MIWLRYLLLITFLLANYATKSQKCPIEEFQGIQYNSKISLTKRQELKIIEVVFHIVYNEMNHNLSDGVIFSQLDILNKAFSDPGFHNFLSVPKEFQDDVADPNIYFCLAKIDPNGNPTSGITRKKTTKKSIGCRYDMGKRSVMFDRYGGTDIWNPKKYINIYVSDRSDCPPAEAIFPEFASDEEDGIILAPHLTGAQLTSYPFHMAKTLIHEMGHYFGLRHLAGGGGRDTCENFDAVDDTPIQKLNYTGCPTYPQISCGNSSMFMNYMSLVDDPCMFFFTQGQVERMNQAISLYRSTLCISSCDQNVSDEQLNFNFFPLGSGWYIQKIDQGLWSGQLELFNLEGKKVWEQQLYSQSGIFVPGLHRPLNQGIFILKIEAHSKTYFLKLFNTK
ncbi:MAG: zinc-dependent metalloprotease [Bacteroidota bacterium]|nr:zinc-dependent metalloprotease [Bacteroidota bacterium]